MKILVGTNCLTNIDSSVYANHCAEMFALGAKYGHGNVLHWASRRLSIDRMRNECAKIAMQNECDYLVFIDDDMLLHPGTISGLVESEYDIIMAHTYIRSYPFQPMAFKNVKEDPEEGVYLAAFTEEEIKEKSQKEPIVDAYAVGFAACAIKVDLLLNMRPPYFVTGPASTEDVYFCLRAKKEIGEHVRIGVHTGFPTAHLVDPVFIHTNTRNQLMTIFAPPKKEFREDDRSLSYHEQQAKA